MKSYPVILFTAVLLTACKPGGGHSPRYETVSISRGSLTSYVTATGTLSAVVSVDVGSQVSGRIVTLNADYNSPVKKGELVAEIDPSVYQAKVKEAEGDLASAEANVVLKEKQLARTKMLVPIKAAAEIDLEQVVAELAQAKATVTMKEAVLDRARADLSFCKILAPVDGIVISRKVDIGQTVTAAMTTPVLYTIAQDIREMQIVASVSEADIGQVKPGQSVDFKVDAYPDEAFHGTLTQIRKAPVTKENVVTYETIITVNNEEQKLLPGMTAEVSVLVAERADVAKIPNSALRFSPPEGTPVNSSGDMKLERRQQLVYVAGDDGKSLQAAIVTTGITDGTDTEVLGGIDHGTKVVISATGTGRKGMMPEGGPPPT
ncbi:efflux RND transporter periplasmic adaptor subunit [Luteolibacter luteus]|uniref:Efflux RND transporter periplasmic adaptor subunit n=1 Tax=Luteolibacter luteus TaxID=2728835 RepID=A0A858RCV9_9BACT|nr:efflux RND transporter periplasmic adaptor subunit [Luteolibacter luteus]QJE94444.1 efflux RND transporter periplasmic adaptor subunit [Luteolibacter luteus]